MSVEQINELNNEEWLSIIGSLYEECKKRKMSDTEKAHEYGWTISTYRGWLSRNDKDALNDFDRSQQKLSEFWKPIDDF